MLGYSEYTLWRVTRGPWVCSRDPPSLLFCLISLLTAGHPAGEFRPGRCGAFPVHPSSGHHHAFPGLPAALPVPTLPGPTGPRPGVQHRPPRAHFRRGDRLLAQSALGQRAECPLLPTACLWDSAHNLPATLLRRSHGEPAWERGPGHTSSE